MNAYDFVHLSLLAVGGEVKGKTKLQKTVYFLGIIADCLGDLGYRPHFYGPYSEDVAQAINRLKSLGFVDQNVAGIGSVDQSGFEVARYDFRLNDQGRSIAEQKSKAHADLWEKMTAAAEVLRKAGDMDYMKLSIAAKTYFMLGEKKGQATTEELAQLAKRFGWSVTPEQANDAVDFLQRAGLVEVKNF